MSNPILQSPDHREVIQFSVFIENKVGRLNELLAIFGNESVHVMAICSVDNTDSGITRLIVDYAEEARRVLDIYGFSFSENIVVAVEIETEAQLRQVTTALAAAEINLHYTYPFLTRPNGKSALAIRLEDNELAADVLRANGIRVLDCMDIAR